MKRVKTFPSVLAVLCAVTFSASASTAPYVSEVFPNTDDDAALEYFSLRNPSCQSVALSGYSVADASWKIFRFPSSAVLGPLSSFSYFRPETKIALNNENETLSLFDPFGVSVDSFAYAVSSKNVPVSRSGFSDDLCAVGADGDSGVVAEVSAESGTDVGTPEEIPPEFPEGTLSGTLDAWEGWTPETAAAETSGESLPSPEVPNPDDAPGSATEWAQDSAVPTTALESVSSGTGTSEPPALSWSAAVTVDPAPTWFVANPAPVSVSSSVAKTSDARALAEALALVDSNADGRFDYAEIRYSEAVFWTPDPMEFLLYSKTGGLYERRVSSTWGYFSSAVAVGPVLRLAFSGTTLPKTSFRVDSSTSSEFRIKTSSSMSSLKTASSWLPVVPLGLTTSFSGYSADRISFVPAFPEVESTESDAARESADGEIGTASGGQAWKVSVAWSGNTGDIRAPLPDSEKPATRKTGSQTVSKSRADISVPDGFSIVPSSWIDLLPDGKYLLVCFSKTCSPSFKAEGLPSKTKGHWSFADGRKRYGASTSTLWKSVPAKYRLSYVIETPEGVANIPIELSVVPEPPTESLKTKAENVTKAASSSSKALQAKSPIPKTTSSSVKSASGKTSTKEASSEVRSGGEESGPIPYRTVSAAVASAFLWLAGWAGWLAYRRRAWLPEETP